MVNIDDNMERTKVNEVARDLVTYSLRDEADKSKEEIELPGGNKVKIVDVSFNKEQNIDVTKTYIATVKKSVSKVSEDFYKITPVAAPAVAQSVVPSDTPVTETSTNQENIEDALKMSMPELDLNQPLVVEPEPEKVEEVAPVETVPTEPVVSPLSAPEPVVEAEPQVELPKEESVVEIPTAPIPETDKEAEVVAAPVSPIVVPPIVEPEVVAPIAEPVVEVEPQVELPKEEPVAVIPAVPIPEPEKVTEETQISPEVTEPVASPLPSVEPTIPTPVVSASEAPKLFFDGSTESNLNKALGEESIDKVVAAPQEGVESLREFGVDTPSIVPEQTENVKTLTRSRGFANNKFFMVIAIVLFIIACVFLGYEAFHYFQLVK